MIGERPILFSDAMVRAILAGTKTQTRRVITSREPISFIGCRGEEDDPSAWGWFFDGPDHHGYMVLGRGHDERHDHGSISIRCPYGSPGDRLWVREAWGPLSGGVTYRAMAFTECPDGARWRPSIHMPRWASRLTLEVTDVRVERLQSISGVDALAEGITIPVTPEGRRLISLTDPGVRSALPAEWRLDHPLTDDEYHRAIFGGLWDSLARPGSRWADNPWVWVVTFRRCEQTEGAP